MQHTRSTMRQYREVILSTVVSLAVLLTATVTDVWPALAQATPAESDLPPQPPAPSMSGTGPQLIVTPYLWLAGINAAISTPLARAPVVDTSVGAFQMLGHLDASRSWDRRRSATGRSAYWATCCMCRLAPTSRPAMSFFRA